MITSKEAAGRTARLYGEWFLGYTVAKKADGSTYNWSDFYNTAMCKEGKVPASRCVVPDDAINVTSTIPSAQAMLSWPPLLLVC